MKKTAQRLKWIIVATLSIACVSWADFLVQKKHHLIGGGINRTFLFLLINVHLLLTGFLFFLIIRHSIKLFMERRRGVAGSLFTRNLVLCFMLFSVLPATFIMTMAGSAIIKNINQWFCVRLAGVFESTNALHCLHTAALRSTMSTLGQQLSTASGKQREMLVEQQSRAADGLQVFTFISPTQNQFLLSEIKQWRQFRELNDRTTKNLRRQFIVLLEQHQAGEHFDFFGSLYWVKRTSDGWLLLVYRYPTAVRQALIATQNAQYDFITIKQLQSSIQLSYLSSFALMVLFIIFLALWAAFYLARGITKPLAELLQATQRLQQGDLTTRVPAMLDSDLAQLADAFNSMAQALAQTQQRLEQEQKVKTWQEAAKQLAHEIKNPLTPIQLATERLQRKLGKQLADDPVFHGCTTTILEQVATIQELIKHFVQFASLPAVCLQECNMARLIEEVLLLYRVSYPAVDFIVEIDQEAPWVTIMTDGAKIKLALVNLIDNSLRAMHLQQDASAHAIIISLQHDAQAHELVLTLADTGPGVAAQVRETLFLPHVSTSKKNMGLGLAIVFQLFKQLGGSICLAPSKRGALFVCRLPCHKAVPKD